MRPVNLLPSSDRARRVAAVPSNASYIVLGVLAALLLAVVAVVMTGNQVTTRTSEIAKARQETQAAQAQVAKLGPFGQFSAVKQTRLDSVTSLSGARFDWERLMRELALVLPDDVWIIEANASAAGVVGSASGAAAPTGPAAAGPTDAPGSAGAAPATPKIQVVGCAPSQPDVAEVMVRLRNLHRAEDVQLAESTQPTAGEAGVGVATTGGCGSSFKFDVTVSFSAAPPPSAQGERGGLVPSQLGGGA